MSELHLPGEPSLWEAIGFSVVGGSFALGQVTCNVGSAGPGWAFAGTDAVPNERSC